jgi:crossover junction endodeoxyribonuclease RuvC
VLILGIDPGYDRCGFALLRVERSTPTLEASGIVTTDAGSPMPARLRELHCDILGLLRGDAAGAQAVAMESLHIFNPASSANVLRVAQARGVVLCVLGGFRVGVHDYTPSAIKKAVTGDGRAKKAAVVAAMSQKFPGYRWAHDDAADAGAVALTHALALGLV